MTYGIYHLADWETMYELSVNYFSKLMHTTTIPPPGWEYSVEAGLGVWLPYERNVHLCRRRRWVRLRKRDKNSKAVENKKVSRAQDCMRSVSIVA